MGKGHSTWIEERDGLHRARCSCHWTSSIVSGEREAGDAIAIHQRDVERATRKYGVGNLSYARNWYRQQSEREDISVKDRDLWKVLADELDARLNEPSPEDEAQQGLW